MRDLDGVGRGCTTRDRYPEPEHETAGFELAHCGYRIVVREKPPPSPISCMAEKHTAIGGRLDRSPDADNQAADEHGPPSAVPVGEPANERKGDDAAQLQRVTGSARIPQMK